MLNTPLSFIATDLRFDVTTSGAVAVSALLVGAAVGSVVAGQIADALGPGRALLWNNTTLILGAILAASTPLGFWGLVAGVTCSAEARHRLQKALESSHTCAHKAMKIFFAGASVLVRTLGVCV